MKDFKLAICQNIATEDKEKNVEHALEMVAEAAQNGAEVVVLGEMFNCPYHNKFFVEFAEECPGPTTKKLAEAAKEHGIILIGGSIPERDGDKLYNTSFTFDSDGKLLGKHRKIHLFDIDIDGGVSFKESDTFSPGEKCTVFDTKFGKFGVLICFDIRFPEIFSKTAKMGAEMIFLPAAFNKSTGPDHWEISNRMRALDNQIFVCGAAPARNVGSSYESYANSRVCDPWGNVIAKGDESEMIVYCDIHGDEIEKIRRQLPLLKNRRPELY